MEQILIQQLQMQQERYNAEIIAATSSSVRSFLSTVPAFRGDSTELVRFIQSIDTVSEEISKLPRLDATLKFEQIKNLLQGQAKCILRENPSTWEEIKVLLIRSFSDPESLGFLQDKVEKINFQGSIQKTFSSVQYCLMR